LADPKPVSIQAGSQDTQACINERHIKNRLDYYTTQQVTLDMMRADLDWLNQNKADGPAASFEALNKVLSERWAKLVDESKTQLNCAALEGLLADPKPVSIQAGSQDTQVCFNERHIKNRLEAYTNKVDSFSSSKI
jgi:hypothetical protein